jgi:hypothetical protein
VSFFAPFSDLFYSFILFHSILESHSISLPFPCAQTTAKMKTVAPMNPAPTGALQSPHAGQQLHQTTLENTLSWTVLGTRDQELFHFWYVYQVHIFLNILYYYHSNRRTPHHSRDRTQIYHMGMERQRNGTRDMGTERQ